MGVSYGSTTNRRLRHRAGKTGAMSLGTDAQSAGPDFDATERSLTERSTRLLPSDTSARVAVIIHPISARPGIAGRRRNNHHC